MKPLLSASHLPLLAQYFLVIRQPSSPLFRFALIAIMCVYMEARGQLWVSVLRSYPGCLTGLELTK